MGKKQRKSHDMKLNNWIKNTKKDKPYVSASGQVMWGTTAENSRKKGVLAKEPSSKGKITAAEVAE